MYFRATRKKKYSSGEITQEEFNKKVYQKHR